MSNEQPSQYLIDAILHKLGVLNQRDVQRTDEQWQAFHNQRPYFYDVTQKICDEVAAKALGRILQRRLDGFASPSLADQKLFAAFQEWGFANGVVLRGAIRQMLKPPVGAAVRPAPTRTAPAGRVSPVPVRNTPSPIPARPLLPPVMPMKPPHVPVPTRPAPFAPQPQYAAPAPTPLNVAPASPPPTPQPPQAQAQSPPPLPQNVATPAPENSPVIEPPMAPEVPAPVYSQWKYLPLPENEPDPHDEFESREGRSPEQYEILGARVRGKKHKHDGTHCDDWFSFCNAGSWTVLAVSDGGGSYHFSRVGAKAACEAVTQCLSEKLSNHLVADRDVWEATPDVEYVNDSLVAAVIAAWDAVKRAVEQRETNPEFARILGRPLTTKDLYCTLLVTVHTTIRYQGAEKSLIFGLAVGDGMMAAVDHAGRSCLLMTPDSGEHSGEVRFLDQREVEPAKLRSKIFPVLCNLRALLLMTDGVADDYFPNDPGMTWLYGDLVLNDILPVPAGVGGDLSAALDGTKVSSTADLSAEDCVSEFELLRLDQSIRKVRVRFVSKLAEKLGLPAEEVVRRGALLEACRGHSEDLTTRHARLQEWLDSYHVRGSFDDRTLLVMHR
ncbi:MAG: protein phosphatase 2C domain-containing protein [Planctomycetaceae bacterium]